MNVGCLYLCATPIGNREDISARVLRVLQEADMIAAEDTRHSRGLLQYYGIQTPLISYHEHNKYERAEELVARLLQGDRIALISDAGTPVISDPGEVLVQKARECGIPVTSLPGPCALITALSLSGIPARRFVFEGFLPQESKERREVLGNLQDESRTIILYEAPHRLRKTLGELQDVLGADRPLCLCRELTKIHEEALTFTLQEALAYYEAREPRGEYVLVLAGKSKEAGEAERKNAWEALSPEEHLKAYMGRGLDKKAAMKAMAADFGLSRNEIYKQLLKN